MGQLRGPLFCWCGLITSSSFARERWCRRLPLSLVLSAVTWALLKLGVRGESLRAFYCPFKRQFSDRSGAGYHSVAANFTTSSSLFRLPFMTDPTVHSTCEARRKRLSLFHHLPTSSFFLSLSSLLLPLCLHSLSRSLTRHCLSSFQLFLKAFLPNLHAEAIVVRRTAAQLIAVVCQHARGPFAILAWTLQLLIGEKW